MKEYLQISKIQNLFLLNPINKLSFKRRVSQNLILLKREGGGGGGYGNLSICLLVCVCVCLNVKSFVKYNTFNAAH